MSEIYDNKNYQIDRDITSFLFNKITSESLEIRLKYILKDSWDLQKKLVELANIIMKLLPGKAQSNKKDEKTSSTSNLILSPNGSSTNQIYANYYESLVRSQVLNNKNMNETMEDKLKELEEKLSIINKRNEKLEEKCNNLENKIVDKVFFSNYHNKLDEELKKKFENLIMLKDSEMENLNNHFEEQLNDINCIIANNQKSNSNNLKRIESMFEEHTTIVLHDKLEDLKTNLEKKIIDINENVQNSQSKSENKLENHTNNTDFKLNELKCELDQKFSLITESFDKDKKAKNEAFNSIKLDIHDLEQDIQVKLEGLEKRLKQTINNNINDSLNSFEEIKNNYLTKNQYNDNISKLESNFNNEVKEIKNKESIFENNLSDIGKQIKDVNSNVINNYLKTSSFEEIINNYLTKNQYNDNIGKLESNFNNEIKEIKYKETTFENNISDINKQIKEVNSNVINNYLKTSSFEEIMINYLTKNQFNDNISKVELNFNNEIKEIRNIEITFENNLSDICKHIKEINANITNNYLKTSNFNTKNEEFNQRLSDFSEELNNFKSQNECSLYKIKKNLEELIKEYKDFSQENLELKSKELNNRVNEINNKLEENTYSFLKIMDFNKDKNKIQNETDQKFTEINQNTSDLLSKLNILNNKVSSLDMNCLKSECFDVEKQLIIKELNTQVSKLKTENESNFSSLQSELNNVFLITNNNTNDLKKTKEEFSNKLEGIRNELQIRIEETDKKCNQVSQNLKQTNCIIDEIKKNYVTTITFREDTDQIKSSINNQSLEIKNNQRAVENGLLQISTILNEFEKSVTNNYLLISTFNKKTNELLKDLNETKQQLSSFISQTEKFSEDVDKKFENCESNFQMNVKNINENHDFIINLIAEKEIKIVSLNKNLVDLTSRINEYIRPIDEKVNIAEEKFQKQIDDLNNYLNNFVKSTDYVKDKSYLEKKINQSNESNKELSNKVKTDLLYVLSIKILGGSLITDYFNEMEQILGHSKQLINLYTASKTNYSSYSFHEAARNRSNLLVIINTNNDCLFGFYTSKTFDPEKSISDAKAFIFSLSIKNQRRLIKYPINTKRKQSAITCEPKNFFKLGQGPDIEIPDSCDKQVSSVNFPKTYMAYNLNNENCINHFTAGEKSFLVKELELYHIE